MNEAPSVGHGPPPGRLPPGPTCRVDFSRPLDFTFLGRGVRGFAGDTVASALYAAGVRTFGRSLKYHRPRGLYSMEGESSNTFMAIDGVPNECAETTALRAGMSVRAQNVRGDPRTDFFGLIDPFDRLMPAGFYYRLFHRPYRLWPLFQNGLRRMAGTGVLDPRRDPNRDGVRAERYLNAEVAIVGGGAAGMSAALAAAESGLRVCLFERRPWLGGHLAWRVRDFEGEPLHGRAEALAARLARGGECESLHKLAGNRRVGREPRDRLHNRHRGRTVPGVPLGVPRNDRRRRCRVHGPPARLQPQRPPRRHAGGGGLAAGAYLRGQAGMGGGLQRRRRPESRGRGGPGGPWCRGAGGGRRARSRAAGSRTRRGAR